MERFDPPRFPELLKRQGFRSLRGERGLKAGLVGHLTAVTGGATARGLTAQLEARGAGGDVQLGAGDIPLLHEDLLLDSDTLVDEAGVLGRGPVRANLWSEHPSWSGGQGPAGSGRPPQELVWVLEVSPAQRLSPAHRVWRIEGGTAHPGPSVSLGQSHPDRDPSSEPHMLPRQSLEPLEEAPGDT